MDRIGVAGLGKMGRGLVMSVAASGRPINGWSRSAFSLGALAGTGMVRKLNRFSDLVVESDVIFLLLSDYDAAEEVVGQAGDLFGKTVIGGMSGTPMSAARFCQVVQKMGGSYLDAAIKKGPTDFATPEGGIFYAGDEGAFNAARSSLEFLGGGCQFIGAHPGAAKAFELATLARNYMWVYGYFHALALARAYGLDVNVATKAIMSVSANSARYIEQCASQIASSKYPSSIMATTTTHQTALSYVLGGAKDVGLDFSILKSIAELMKATIDSGWKDRDMPAFYPAFEAAAKGHDRPDTVYDD